MLPVQAFQKLIYVSTLVFGEASSFLLPWKRVFRVTDSQVFNLGFLSQVCNKLCLCGFLPQIEFTMLSLVVLCMLYSNCLNFLSI